MILDRPNHFGQALIVCFGWVKIIRISPEKSTLNLTKMIWTQPKQSGLSQNNLVQNHFGPIEGRGINPYVLLVLLLSPFDKLPHTKGHNGALERFYISKTTSRT